jgi:hypothetical protein
LRAKREGAVVHSRRLPLSTRRGHRRPREERARITGTVTDERSAPSQAIKEGAGTHGGRGTMALSEGPVGHERRRRRA